MSNWATRSDQREIAADVAAVLPSASAKARHANVTRYKRTGQASTTFCALCGGNKERTSTNCRSCFLRLRAKRDTQRGGRHNTLPRGADARQVAFRQRWDQPPRPRVTIDSGLHTHGAGHTRAAPPARRFVKGAEGWQESPE